MFPNDDICNVRAAKNAARRIFERYGMPSCQQSQSKGLGQQEVSGLIKNAYNAINITYNPSINDVSSFMSVFGVGNDGKIQLDKLEELAVKYLCGEDALKTEVINLHSIDNAEGLQTQDVQKSFSQVKKQKPAIQVLSVEQDLNAFQNSENKNMLIPPSQAKNLSLKFLSPRANQSNFSSKQNTFSNKKSPQKDENKIIKRPTYSQILNQANEIFNQHKNRQKGGITLKQATQVLTKTYRLIGKAKFSPSQEDVKIWMKLCDSKKNEVVEWVSYQNFVKRMMERQNILETHQN